MKIVSATLHGDNDHRYLSTGQPLTAGVPLPEGAVSQVDQLYLDIDGNLVDAEFSALLVWPDNSIKWVKVVCLTPAGLRADSSLQVCIGNQQPMQRASISIAEHATYLQVLDGEYEVCIANDGSNDFPTLRRDGKVLLSAAASVRWLDTDGRSLELLSRQLSGIERGRLSCAFTVESSYRCSDKTLNLQIRYRYYHSGVLEFFIEVHNPARAKHTGGLWDLGDPGAAHFSELAIDLSGKFGQCQLRAESNAEWLHASDASSANAEPGNLTLFQASSGGDNWDSVAHCDANGVVANAFCGYQLSVGGQKLAGGRRAQPVIRAMSEGVTGYMVNVPEFWQNFPGSVELSGSSLQLGLFPAAHGQPYELQGGEKKTRQVVVTMNSEAPVDYKPPVLRLNPVDVAASGVLRYTQNCSVDTPYDRLLVHSLCDRTGLMAKREVVDEYGWRHFGEVYADHESHYYDGDDTFVSHYNNQYDGIYGFGRQYLLTGDQRWYTLMHDLARHVLDIDIYHTTQDKPEYNGGLFWHTDHFVKAFTSSHRTYSRHQTSSDGGPVGGGPGAEHCYTTGLVLYYGLSGDERAKTAVLGLQRWIEYFYEGNGSLLDCCYRLIKHERTVLLDILRGRKPFRYQYPFDRGVGNFIIALLDCYELTGDKKYLAKAEVVICSTFGDSDAIESRNLEQVEYTWFYTVFLQAVVRFLDTKRQLNEYDAGYASVKSAFLYYARWMAKNEVPYLSRAHMLQLPSHTWVAQEVRKSALLYAAYRYASDDRDVLRQRAIFFRDYAVDALQNEPTLGFARIQILLMQNHGTHGLLDEPAAPYAEPELPPIEHQRYYHTVAGFFLSVAKRFYRSLRTFDLRREIQWVKTRVR